MPPHSALLSELYRLTSPPPGDAELLRRWVERRDEDAFTALVSRHGRMVHGVCRRVLGNSHDADDAFQAVFLTLARKAAALRHPEAVSGWLHGVAVRLACKARAAAVRRRFACGADFKSALQEPADPHPDPLESLSACELMGLIDREISRLPEKYRLPLLLCDLEQRTQEEAARLLGWTLGTFRGRLLRGREQLRVRLVRRGIAPAVLAAVFATSTADAAALIANVSRLAVRFAACPTSAEISPSVAALVREGIGSMMLEKLKFAAVVLLAASTLVAGVGLLIGPIPAPQPAEERADEKPPSAKPQVRRDRAGDPLPPEAIARLGTLRFRHGGNIRYLAFGPDGKTLVSCADGIRVWDAATGKVIPRFPPDLQAYSIALSPDGKELAVCVSSDKQADKPIAIYEYATGRLLRRFGEVETPVELLYSPNGKVLAASDWSRHRDIELWDPIAGRRLHTLKGHTKKLWCKVFSADSKTLVSGSDDKTIRFWDVATGKEIRQIKHKQGIGKIALSPDGKLLASIDKIYHRDPEFNSGYWDEDNHVRIWDAAAGKELRRLAMPAVEPIGGFEYLCFAPDGKTLLTGGMDGVLRIWDAATGRELRQFPGFSRGPTCFAFAPDKKTWAVVDGGCTIRLLDPASGKDRLPLEGHNGRISSIGVTPGNQAIATIGPDKTLRFWEPATGRELRRRAVLPDNYGVSGLRPDGRTYLTIGPDKLYRLRDLADGEERVVVRVQEKLCYPFALSPDGKLFAAAKTDDKVVRLFDPATGAVRHKLTKVNHYVSGMSFSADNRTLVVWDGNQIVTVWDAATGKKRRQFTPPPDVASNNPGLAYKATLSPDGKLLIFALQTPDTPAKMKITLLIADTSTGKEVRRFKTEEVSLGVLSGAFSPDSKSLALIHGRDNAISLTEVATGRERHRFTGSTGHIFSLAFSADGKLLISGSDDTTALVWDLTGRLTMGKKFGAALSAAELETHWKTLAGEDAPAAFRAIQSLAADPARSIPYLRARLHPVAVVEEKRLQQWIADLDNDQLAARQKATAELEKVGGSAMHAMQKALADKPSLETRRRLEPLIEKQQREEWSPSAENLRSRRAVEVLERVGTPEAKEVLTILANGAPGAWQTMDAKAALERLTRPK